jgi:CRISPR/Cas system CSM-associated protein Csm5 (group 7 of RAMP superfamily)
MFVEAIDIFVFVRFFVFDVSDEDGERGVEEWFEEGRVKVDDGEDPVERVDDVSDDFEYLIEFLSVPADNNHTLLCQYIMQQFCKFESPESRNQSFNMAELIRNEAVLVRIDQFESTNIGFEF